jgi:hypothetical protein
MTLDSGQISDLQDVLRDLNNPEFRLTGRDWERVRLALYALKVALDVDDPPVAELALAQLELATPDRRAGEEPLEADEAPARALANVAVGTLLEAHPELAEEDVAAPARDTGPSAEPFDSGA